ncbi:hypothetical protein Acy02nite_36560 [Actinoplanes cyaneus]|uniref:DUF4386 family protein n=1 Tax=Actinoplanes cyaneus TaxID=52696 RepID=A0A919IGS9_9ACTN|nr:hypothetical protein [Actinoplanes cyaneus]MCW2139246.1 hypothetical protein [Actinoplanes cyaneus]GID65775.1 hypothetical protein Acy02nite_36560 [Actinoplanes cyaneus]
MSLTLVARARPGPTGTALLLAPVGVLAGWAIMRLGGSRSAGAGWVAAHAVWIVGWGLFGLIITELWRRAGGSRPAGGSPRAEGSRPAGGSPRAGESSAPTAPARHNPAGRAGGSGRAAVAATAGAVVAAAGLLAVLGQMVVDIVVGVAAPDRARMNELFEQAFRIPGVHPVLYGFGPLLLIAGLVALFVQLAVLHRVRPGTTVLAVLGLLLISADTTVGPVARLVVMPAGLLCLWLSFSALVDADTAGRGRERAPA